MRGWRWSMKMCTRFCVALAVAAPVAAVSAAGVEGLTQRDGVLYREGRPFRGIGVNDFDLFLRLLHQPTNSTSLAGLQQLGEARIPFVRFPACGFWPADWKLYQSRPDAHFGQLDRVVRAAEACGVGLIPSLFWRHETVPELVGESQSAWGNPVSQTHAFMRRYTEAVVVRYRNSPAIWGWEFCNEMSLAVDLPNAQHLIADQKAIPHLGVPKHGATDALTATNLLVALRAFGETVRHLDPQRIVVSGNSAPRPGAWHNSAERSWTLDTREQFVEVLLRDNPDPLSVLCVHWYPDGDARFSKERPATQAEVFQALMSAAARARKPLFIGEFGVSAELGPEREKAVFAALLNDLEQADVPLAALWVFDMGRRQNAWNVTFDNERAYMLELIAASNRRRAALPPAAGRPAQGPAESGAGSEPAAPRR